MMIFAEFRRRRFLKRLQSEGKISEYEVFGDKAEIVYYKEGKAKLDHVDLEKSFRLKFASFTKVTT